MKAAFSSSLFLFFLLSPLLIPPAFAARGVDVLDREREQTRPQPQAQPRMWIQDDSQAGQEGQGESLLLKSLQLEGTTAFSADELLEP